MDEDFIYLANEEPLSIRAEVTEDHRTQDVPVHTALFVRTFPTYTETMWLHAYAGARCIVVSYPGITFRGDSRPMPGVIRTIPIGWRDMASAETFRARFEQVAGSLTKEGWTSRPHIPTTH